MIIVLIILGYGLFVAAVTSGLVRLLPRWAAWKIVTAAILLSDLIVVAVGVIHAILAAQPIDPYPASMFEPGFVIFVALIVYCAAVIIGIPAAMLASWAMIPRKKILQSEPVEPVGRSEE
ncbi:MAG: hypothetical protein Q8R02_10655 [Hyphomonadaceae bacterium]|nr:hypothetical protein [Hyphomonadaceae bacterium]